MVKSDGSFLQASSNNHYPREPYIKTMLSSGTDKQNTQLSNQSFYKDDSDVAEADPVSASNMGLEER